MTATPADIPHSQAGVEKTRPDSAVSASHDVKVFAISITILLAIFLLLQNQYWVPGGDSEVYTGAARSILQGQGFRFNGVPVSIVPPGWSIALAGVMKISSEFLVLKLFTMSCMLGSLAMMYWICRRFVPPGRAGMIIVLSGIISHVYCLTFWLHSDAFFCLFSTAALLLAFQINEGRKQIWRMMLLALCCVIAVSVRWAGLFSTLLVCAVLLHGELRPRLTHRWILAALCALLTMGTFLSIRAAIRVSAEEQKAIMDVLGREEGTGDASPPPLEITQYKWFNPATGGILGLAARLAAWGHWFSYLFWQPFRIGRFLVLPSLLLGWTILLPLLLLAGYAFATRRWIWLGLVVYSFALAMNWPQPVARYLVPVAPLILLGVFVGFPLLFKRNFLIPSFLILAIALPIAGNAPGKAWEVILRPILISLALFSFFFVLNIARKRISDAAIQSACSWLIRGFIASLILCNGALWAVDVYVARSKDFYGTYEAGLNKDLIAACKWLNENQPDSQIAISRLYVNMGKRKTDSVLGPRVSAMLTGRSILSVPDRYVRAPGPEYVRDPRRNQNFLAWARQLNIKYVLFQPQVSPWRVFHFRMGWLQQRMTKEEVVDTGAGWRLYEIPAEGDTAKRISIPAAQGWPTSMPGL